MFEQINTKEAKYAKYLENIVSNKDLVAFICEDAGDVKKFMQQMHSMKLTVNIFHVVQEHSSTFQPLYSIDRYKYVSITQNYTLRNRLQNRQIIIIIIIVWLVLKWTFPRANSMQKARL